MPTYKSYTRPYMNRTSGRPGKMKKFNAPLPVVTKKSTKQSVATPAYVRSAVRRALKNKDETKFVINGYSRQTLYHNGGTNGVSGACQFNMLAPSNLPITGDEDTQRDGTKIQLRGVRLNILITFPYDRLASKVVMYVIRVNKGYNPLSSYSHMFDLVSTNWLLDSIDTGRVKVLKKRIFQIKNINPNVPVAGANREITIPYKHWVNLKGKTIQFNENNTNDNTFPYDYIAVFAGYDAWGSLTSDIVSYVKLDQKLYFKDI